MKITYKHFVNPEYKGDEDPFSNPLPNPLPNPTSPLIPSNLQHHSLNDLQGVDYSWVHYGGDEFAHTLYTYYWMSHYFGPDSNGRSRLYKLENVGFDSDLRKKTRAYLSQRITANWTFLDLLYAVGLYHDIGKVREKETDDHHSIAGKYMWDEFIADALDVPHTFEDIVSTMLESDIGRRNISDDFFQTQVGEYYGVALIMQMADIATHHPHMFTGYAATARKAGLFKGNVREYKMWAIGEKVKKLEKFLEKPLKNPRPAATQITWRGDYGIESVNTSLAFSVLDDFKKSGRDEVWSLGQGASTFYMGFTGENVSRLKGLIPEGEESRSISGRTAPRLRFSSRRCTSRKTSVQRLLKSSTKKWVRFSKASSHASRLTRSRTLFSSTHARQSRRRSSSFLAHRALVRAHSFAS